MTSKADSTPINVKVLARLVSARTFDQWVSIDELAIIAKKQSLYTILRRFLKKKLIQRRRIRNAKNRLIWVYQATDAGHTRLEKGGLPRGARVGPKDVLVSLRPMDEILDMDGVYWESRQVVIKVDNYTAKVLRNSCDPPKPKKKGKEPDRAEQLSHSTAEFVIVITNRGTCTITLKSPDWEKVLIAWMKTAGLSQKGIVGLMNQIKMQLPYGHSRIEIPVLEQAIKRLNVQCRVDTVVGSGVSAETVSSNINYSMDIGLEFFGLTKWVDTLLAVLAGLQHSTVVSEVARDQTLAALVEKIEILRKEKEEGTNDEKKEPPSYYI